MSALRALFFRPADIASLVVFRMAFGLIMLWEVLVYFRHDWIGDYWVRPIFHFTYPGFAWVHPWPGNGMYIHMAVLGALAACVAAGLFYRVTAALFCLGFTYTFLLEHARYLNHFYFVCLVSFLMIFVPAHRAFSLDAQRRPAFRSEVIPFWPVWLLRAQLAIVYIFAGIAKLNRDWFDGHPLNSWLRQQTSTPMVGPLFARPETFNVISLCGLAFDFGVVPLLMWKRTRPFAFCAAVAFHLMNAWFFKIGIFPWFSIAMTTLFFDPGWPRQLLARLRSGTRGLSAVTTTPSSTAAQHRITLLVSAYVAVQVLLPFRHWLYPGDVAWNEEGHEFSWRMKLREKVGRGAFTVIDPERREAWFEDPLEYLTLWQAEKVFTRPELLRQFAHYLAQRNEQELGRPVEVHVDAYVELNGHPAAALVDPEVDLGHEPYSLATAKWVTPRPTAHALASSAGR